MNDDDKVIADGLKVILLGISAGVVISPLAAALVFAGIAIYYGFDGLWVSFNSNERYEKRVGTYVGNRSPQPIPSTASAPLTDEPTIADRIKEVHIKNDFKCPSCGATVLPTDIKCKHCDSILVAVANLPRPQKWADVEIGQTVQVKHPQKGKMNFSVLNHIYYGELWQAKMKPDVPWTLTGNYYVRLGFGDDTYLLNWQNRFYYLDSQSFLTDMDINRDFAKSAREFAASNQTKDVSFTYDDVLWNIIDIGRFRIEFAEGDGIRVSAGAVGRFIHSMHNTQIMVVEDYQTGGGGLDRLWKGYQIEEEDIKL